VPQKSAILKGATNLWVSNYYPSTSKAIFSSVRFHLKPKSKAIQAVRFSSILKSSTIILTSAHVKRRQTKELKRIQPSLRPNIKVNRNQLLFNSIKTKMLKLISLSILLKTKTKQLQYKYLKKIRFGRFFANLWAPWSTFSSWWIWFSLLTTGLKLRL